MRSDGIEVFFTCKKHKMRRNTSRKPVRGTNGNESMGAYYIYDGVSPHGAYIDNFLMSRVGQVWDSVYSEICQRADLRSRRGREFRKWVGWRVDLHTFYDPQGKIRVMHRIGVITKPAGFLVDPEGILRFFPYDKKHCNRSQKDPQDYVKIDDTKEYRKIDGVWYYIHFQWVPTAEMLYYQRYQILERDRDTRDWTKTKVILEKKQLSKKQLQDLKLRRL